MKKNPEIQFRSPEEIKAYQESRLAEELLYLQNHSRFYQRLFQAHHIDIQQIKTIESLQQIPVTTKTDLQLHNEDFICVSRDEIIDYVTTSGTLGDPVTFGNVYRLYHSNILCVIGFYKYTDTIQNVITSP